MKVDWCGIRDEHDKNEELYTFDDNDNFVLINKEEVSWKNKKKKES